MAIGTSGNQFKNAGVVGRLMRELIEAQQATLMSPSCMQSPVLGRGSEDLPSCEHYPDFANPSFAMRRTPPLQTS